MGYRQWQANAVPATDGAPYDDGMVDDGCSGERSRLPQADNVEIGGIVFLFGKLNHRQDVVNAAGEERQVVTERPAPVSFFAGKRSLPL